MDKAVELQQLARMNAAETEAALQDLMQWESGIKAKDKELRTITTVMQSGLPPVRGRSTAPPPAADPAARPNAVASATAPVPNAPAKRIKGSDFRAWDKFVANDLDRVIEAVDAPEASSLAKAAAAAAPSLDDTPRAAAAAASADAALRRAQGEIEKDKGNAQLKEGKFAAAVACYTRGMAADPTSALLPANRALAHLKLKQYTDAERDCDTALGLDPTYVKAWARRGAARRGRGLFRLAIEDYQKVLALEPVNAEAKQAIPELRKLAEARETEEKRTFNPLRAAAALTPQPGVPKLVDKASDAAAPSAGMRRIVIEEVGSSCSDESDTDEPVAKPLPKKVAPATATPAAAVVSPAPTAATNTTNTSAAAAAAVPVVVALSAPTPKAAAATLPKQSAAATKPPAAAARSSVSSPAASKGPATYLDFERMWKALRSDPARQTEFMLTLEPERVPTLFRQTLDPSVFAELVARLHALEAGRAMAWQGEFLAALATVKRLDTAVLFLSDADRARLTDVVARTVAAAADPAATEARLRAAYKLS